jgi:hypothetical protein
LGSPLGHGANPDGVGLGAAVGEAVALGGGGVGEESSQPLTVEDGNVWSVIGRGARPRKITIAATTVIITSASTPMSNPIPGRRGVLGTTPGIGGGCRGSFVVAADQAVPSQ